jgi:hypothetical protein
MTGAGRWFVAKAAKYFDSSSSHIGKRFGVKTEITSVLSPLLERRLIRSLM